ncbi:methyltransferase family protein [Paraburkholderia phenoliruptrix]|uniref:methyltransferase family protein n=1 Tax=Paraburkholderia phenoliruptrix TaxID=252970 RepID=UPI0001C01F3D
MIRKFLTGLAAVALIFALPALLLQPQALLSSKLWAVALAGMLASLTQPAYSPLDHDAPPEDRGTAKQLVWTVYLTLLAGMVESLTLHYPESMAWDAFAVGAFGVAIAGALLRAWAVAALGRFFTWHVRVQSGQQVVSSGPYRLVRHPGYTGAWFLYVGILLGMHAPLAAALAGFLLLVAFVRRIGYEEQLMLQTFGDEYLSYSRRVRRLLPLVW